MKTARIKPAGSCVWQFELEHFKMGCCSFAPFYEGWSIFLWACASFHTHQIFVIHQNHRFRHHATNWNLHNLVNAGQNKIYFKARLWIWTWITPTVYRISCFVYLSSISYLRDTWHRWVHQAKIRRRFSPCPWNVLWPQPGIQEWEIAQLEADRLSFEYPRSAWIRGGLSLAEDLDAGKIEGWRETADSML